MNEIGELLRSTREDSGVSLEEASADLKIKTLILENMEEGNMGCFKDVFVLKNYIYDYSKYLGLNPDKIIDQFNEYLFEYTSKIPVDDIEKAMTKQRKEEVVTDRVSSPYTICSNKHSLFEIFLYVLFIVLVLVLIIWTVRQFTASNEIANIINSVK